MEMYNILIDTTSLVIILIELSKNNVSGPCCCYYTTEQLQPAYMNVNVKLNFKYVLVLEKTVLHTRTSELLGTHKVSQSEHLKIILYKKGLLDF